MPALLCLLRLLILSHRIENFQTNTWAFLFLFFMQSIFFRTKFGWDGCDDDDDDDDDGAGG
jgi:hypothetical protein